MRHEPLGLIEKIKIIPALQIIKYPKQSIKVYFDQKKRKQVEERRKQVEKGVSEFDNLKSLDYETKSRLRNKIVQYEIKRIKAISIRWNLSGTAPLTGERAQATLRGRPRGRLGRVGSGKGCLRGRPRGRLGIA